MKILTDVYHILRVSRSMSTINTHPMSSMLNRNLRIFENIKLVLTKDIQKEISQHDKASAEHSTPSLFSERDYKMNDVQSRIVVMGIEDPQLHFKTVCNGLEKYGGDVLKKVDLDIDEGPSIQPRKNSMISWLNP